MAREAGIYERVTTLHAQRHFPRERVTALLGRAGLECVGVHGVLDDGALDAEADELRHLKVLYVARLAKGGDDQVTIKKTEKPVLPALSVTKIS